MERAELRRVHRRLLPVYVIVFLQGSVFWYSIEKLFMSRIGFDAAGIGAAVALVSAATILAETPSGILADRWSRRGVLALAGGSLLVASLVGALSSSVPAYLVCSALTGVHLALASGTSDAIGYEEVHRLASGGGRPADAAAVLGRMRIAEGAALVLSAVAGGLLADGPGLRTTYWITLVPAAASVALALLIRDPAGGPAPAQGLGRHVRQTFAALAQDRSVLRTTAVLVLLTALTYAVLDFTPLWLIALSAPVSWFGPVAAAVLVGYAAGGALGGWIAGRRGRLAAVLLVQTGAALVLVLARSTAVAAAGAVLLVLVLVALTVAWTSALHHRLPTAVRAGAASAVSTLGRLVLIPFALGFGELARAHSVFAAGWLLAGATVAVAVLVLAPSRR